MNVTAQLKQQILRATFIAVFLTFSAVSGVAQSPIYNQAPGNISTDGLLSMGNTAYENNDYLSAAMILFAYIQRDPAALSDSTFRASFYQVYNYSRDQLTAALAAQQQQHAKAAVAALPGTNVVGLTAPKPHMKGTMGPLQVDIGLMGGTDYANPHASSATECSNKCGSDAGCVAMTYLSATGVCYLKNHLTRAASAKGMTTAIKW